MKRKKWSDHELDRLGLKIMLGSLIFLFIFAFAADKIFGKETTPNVTETLLQTCAESGAVVFSLDMYKYHCMTKHCYDIDELVCMDEKKDKVWRCLGRSIDGLMTKAWK